MAFLSWPWGKLWYLLRVFYSLYLDHRYEPDMLDSIFDDKFIVTGLVLRQYRSIFNHFIYCTTIASPLLKRWRYNSFRISIISHPSQ